MELKDFQNQALDALDALLIALTKQREKAVKIAVSNVQQTDPDLRIPLPDYAQLAWEDLRAGGVIPALRREIPYSARRDGTGRTVPNACLKIPTGGGKTLLGAASVSRILTGFLRKNTGFVLWIVPNEAIYTQTLRQLADRTHPYRQMLDRASAGRVKILDKESPLHRADVESHLCVMLLMLQSANRETKDTLRLFRDRGNVFGFFPNEAAGEAHAALRRSVPNLDCHGEGFLSLVKDSLGNVLRVTSPIIVVDEGHKAYSARAIDTIYGFNPAFVLELSATPKDRPKDTPPRFANWLVDIRGKQLADEQMVKLPINVKVKAGDDWRDCLRESLDHLNRLQRAADRLAADTNRYIRPILLIQVERTGKDQREAGFIHAEDAKAFLLHAGLSVTEVAIKTSEKNDLASPENIDLLSPACPVRAIITKQALQEGWDCPFAYVLCSLSAAKNLSAMTQLVGRIIRQPDATRVGVPLLDECYVICHHVETRKVVQSIKEGLEADGMSDLVQQVREVDEFKAGVGQKRRIERRQTFKDKSIYLPVVNWVDQGVVRPLDYEQDVLSRIDWLAISVDALAARIPIDGSHERQTQTTRVSFTDGSGIEAFASEPAKSVEEGVELDAVYATRMLTDIVPNPWIARGLVKRLLDLLHLRGLGDSAVGAMSGFLVEELRMFLALERDRLAEVAFIEEVAAERIQFRLRADSSHWVMPEFMETDLPATADQLPRHDGRLTEKSVFAPVYRADFNAAEAEFACYVDEHKALEWWHRNVAKAGHYHLQGWRNRRVYPDFLMATVGADGRRKLVVIETKGDQLAGNLDTEYKRKLMRMMSDQFRTDIKGKAGELEIVNDDGTKVECDLILISEWKTQLPARLN